MGKSKVEPIPEAFKDIAEAGAYWDSHDLGDHWAETQPVSFEVSISSEKRYVALERDLSEKLAHLSRERGVSVETLVNMWVGENVG